MLSSNPVEKAQIIELNEVRDIRGQLVFGQLNGALPFKVNRFFMVSEVPHDTVRGAHAHRKCHQLLVCVRGSLKALVDDGSEQLIYELDSKTQGLYMPPLTWGSQFEYSPDAILLVFASEVYEESDYINDYLEFQELKKSVLR